MLRPPHIFSATSLRTRPTLACLIAALAGLSSIHLHAGDDVVASFQQHVAPILDRYCYDCHGYGLSKGGVTLDGLSNGETSTDPELWLRALNNLRTGLMPPHGEARPDDAEREQIVEWIKRKAFALDPAHPDPGRVTVRRLNRVEYRNTVRDLVGVDYDTTLEFPADDTGHGFDNIGEVLTISPMLLEKYLDAAQSIISSAVPTRPRSIAELRMAGTALSVESPEQGTTRRGARFLSYYEPARVTMRHEITIAGAYEVVVDLNAVETYVDNQFDYNECRVTVSVDGVVRAEKTLMREGGRPVGVTLNCDWSAGPHEVVLEITPLTPDRERVRNLGVRLNHILVRGPAQEKHWVETPGYKRFFPRPVPGSAETRRAYARELLSGFASRAYRRPASEQTVARLVELAEVTATLPGGSFETGVSQAMVAVLASPRFLFREEHMLPLEPGAKFPRIDEYSLASRLSYFLWSTMPDDLLTARARAGTLRANLPSELQRMLKDRRAAEFVRNFTGQWLQARDIASVPINAFDVWLRENPSPEVEAARAEFTRIRTIPTDERTPADIEALARARTTFIGALRQPRAELNESLRTAMAGETEMYFGHILREDRSLLELIESDYTFLNERLAKHYGIDGVTGEALRKVTLPPGSPRGGVLTQGTILAVTSNPTRTSPVKRGVFILDNILGAPPPPPPANIPPLEDAAGKAHEGELTLRETLALHASDTLCRSCHNRMDPLGLALENFNALGMWRDAELNQPVETAGQLITGEPFTDIRELKRVLVTERREDFYHCLSEKLLTYALGRGLDYRDTDTLDTLVHALNESGGRPSALLLAIAESVPFQRQRPHPDPAAETVAALTLSTD